MPASTLIRREGTLTMERVPLPQIAHTYGTPCYAYSRAQIERQYRRWDSAFGEHPHLVCYALKANATAGVIELLAAQGSGFDAVSIGEVIRAVRAGGDPKRICFSGVGKSRQEMRIALALGIRCFNAESPAELARLNAVAGEMGKTAPVSLRIIPDVDAHTHANITTGLRTNKFGIALEEAFELYRRIPTDFPNLEIEGLSCHIGSQILSIEPFERTCDVVLGFVRRLHEAGVTLRHIDFGGGAGVPYRKGEKELSPEEVVSLFVRRVRAEAPDPDTEIIVEPGRSMIAEAGVLLTTVEYVKKGPGTFDFCIVDAAMTDLIRPALYGAWHEIVQTGPKTPRPGSLPVTVVGPVCESSDKLGEGRMLDPEEGDVLAILTAGAYGASMASTFNSRRLPMEVLVDGSTVTPLRRSAVLEDITEPEIPLGMVKHPPVTPAMLKAARRAGGRD